MASDQALLVIARTLPPAALPSPLLEPTVTRSSACCTRNGPMPVTAKRRNAWRTGDVPTRRDVAPPNFALALPEST